MLCENSGRLLRGESRSEMRHMVKVLDKACERWGMCISVDKTKILAVGEPEKQSIHPSYCKTEC